MATVAAVVAARLCVRRNEKLPFRGEMRSVMIRRRYNKLEFATRKRFASSNQRAKTHLTSKQDQLLTSLLTHLFSNKRINPVEYLSKRRLLNLPSVLVTTLEVKP